MKDGLKIMRNILILILTCFSAHSNGQIIASEKIDESRVVPWVPKFTMEYQGQYHFGNSEWESSLRIIMTGRNIIAQIVSGEWGKDGISYVMNYDNLRNIEIDKAGNFKSDRYKGKFVRYEDGDVNRSCLKIYNSWSIDVPNGQYEIGCRTIKSAEQIYSGKYAYASYQELDPSELSQMTAKELRLMRNEIFARYGYIFRKGGEMEKHFNRQKWYNPEQHDVTNFLTDIEKRNIELIISAEKNK